MLDVLVVGAGPVGLTLAAELARYGLSVRIVDKAAHPTTTSKALAIWSRSLELFDRMGCTEAFLAAGIHGHGASIRSGGQILGSWNEVTKQVTGGISGHDSNGVIQVTVSGQTFTAAVTVTTHGIVQSVKIHAQSGDLSKVQITLHRAR